MNETESERERVCVHSSRSKRTTVLWCTAQVNRSLQRIVLSPKVPGPQLIHAYRVVCVSIHLYVCTTNFSCLCLLSAMGCQRRFNVTSSIPHCCCWCRSSHTLSLHSSITILSICAVDMSCVSLKYLPLSLSFSDVWILLLLCHRKCQDGINECWMCSVQFSIFAQEIIDSWRALFAHSSTQKNFLSKFLKISSVTFRVQGKAENLPKRLLLLLLLSSLLLLCL